MDRQRQFTATCFVVEEEKFLLLLHPKHKKWLPPGGHLELNETPPEAAKREVLEETGLEIGFIRQENIWVQEWNAESIERPYVCLLEHIPEKKSEPAHQHIDFIFVARPIGGHLTEGTWFTKEEVDRFTTHEEIFFDTQAIIAQISKEFLFANK